ncbi:MAG: ATP-binding protein [Spirochaetota bacterium]
MADSRLNAAFLEDGATIVASLNKILLELEKNPESPDLINRVFRNIHSLKSEAAYLHYDELKNISHEIETCLEDIRNGRRTVDKPMIDDLFRGVDSIQKILDKISKTFEPSVFRMDDAAAETISTTESTANQAAIHTPAEKSAADFPPINDFEKKLLEEARERGEKFYRMICTIDETSPMKYPRVYLLINNLEVLVNVIRTIPPLDTVDEALFSEVTVYFTSALCEKDILSAVNIDEITRIQLASLDYDTFLLKEVVRDTSAPDTGEKAAGSFVRIEAGKLDNLMSFIDELQFRLIRLSKEVSSAGIDKNLTINLKSLSDLAEGLEGLLRDVRLVPLEREFGKLYRFVRDLAQKLDKKIEFSTKGGEIEIDRKVLDLLSDPLVHLVRNAVDHGIETSLEREQQGKPQTGRIFVSAMKNNEKLVLQIMDDGRGISRNEILLHAKKLSIPIQNEESADILALITSPGFSTKQTPDDLSGRGVGLDLVYQKIKQDLAGELRMNSREREGTVFTISIPAGFSLLRLMLVRCGNLTVAIPKRNILKALTLKTDFFHHDETGLLWYENYPVFTVHGKVFTKGSLPREEYALIINHLGTKACLLVDEFLFEKDIPENLLTLDTELSPHVYNISLGKRKLDFNYLSPSVII